MAAISDPEILQAALEGLKLQKTRLESQILALESALNGPRRGRPARSEAASGPGATRGRRTMSPAARKRIAEAQRERWARYRKEKGQA
jgi:hypothetical protein